MVNDLYPLIKWLHVSSAALMYRENSVVREKSTLYVQQIPQLRLVIIKWPWKLHTCNHENSNVFLVFLSPKISLPHLSPTRIWTNFSTCSHLLLTFGYLIKLDETQISGFLCLHYGTSGFGIPTRASQRDSSIHILSSGTYTTTLSSNFNIHI